MRDFLQAGPVNLPLVDLTELDQAVRQHLEKEKGEEEGDKKNKMEMPP